MGGHHDLGGVAAGAVERVEAPPTHWQKRLDAMRDALARRSPPAMHVDEMRRAIEAMPAALYDALGSYARKALAVRDVLVEKGVLDAAELEAAIGWLRAERRRDLEAARHLPEHRAHGHEHEHEHEHEHDHGHGHGRAEPPHEAERIDEHELLTEAMIQGLVARGLLGPGELRAAIERSEMAGPALGARIVARAWTDRSFRDALRADGRAAIARLGFEPLEAQIVAVENTPDTHNLVVCTLCSCYPRSILGSPPAWYVGKAYRARAVREPRRVLAELGLFLADEVRVRVHDSTANLRYLVVPLRPEGTEGWSAQRLERLVTRDSLIGAAPALAANALKDAP